MSFFADRLKVIMETLQMDDAREEETQRGPATQERMESGGKSGKDDKSRISEETARTCMAA